MRTVAGWLVIATVAFGTVGEAVAQRAAFPAVVTPPAAGGTVETRVLLPGGGTPASREGVGYATSPSATREIRVLDPQATGNARGVPGSFHTTPTTRHDVRVIGPAGVRVETPIAVAPR